ncbi:ubiquinone anaerobic biosynthesis accessory factor UbiT [Sinorhizobium psoraleae]
MTVSSAMAVPLRLIPIPAIERATRLVFSHVMARHPGLFDRLGDYADKRYGFIPSDLPVGFLVEPAKARISVHRKPDLPSTDAAVTGGFVLLLGLLEGRLDGDAVFFSRDLTVIGDMEAMLALRNALDDCTIDLPSDIGSLAGPFAPLVRRAASEIRSRVLPREAGQWN